MIFIFNLVFWSNFKLSKSFQGYTALRCFCGSLKLLLTRFTSFWHFAYIQIHFHSYSFTSPRLFYPSPLFLFLLFSITPPPLLIQVFVLWTTEWKGVTLKSQFWRRFCGPEADHHRVSMCRQEAIVDRKCSVGSSEFALTRLRKTQGS